MGGTGNPQALLQQGLLPFLLQKAGIMQPGAPAQTQSPAQRAQAQQPGGPTFSPQMGSARSPQSPPPSAPPGAGPQVQTSPMAGVSNLPKPTAQPIADVRSLEQLIVGWSTRKQQKEHAEAENVAMNLMQAIEGAKQTGDWGPATEILHQNEKLLNKVYKGWLQKAEQAQKQAAAGPEKQDPGTAGFESGVGKHMQQKAQQPPPQAPPQGSQPKTLGGYYLPQAGPAEFTQQQAQSAEAQAAKADPGRTLGSQLTSEEMRTADLAKLGLVVTPKTEAELKKYQAQVQEAMTKQMTAQVNLQKAEADLKGKQVEAASKAAQGKTMEAIRQTELLKARAGVDLVNARIQLLKLHPPGSLRTKQPPDALLNKISQADSAVTYLETVLKTRGKGGITKEDMTVLGPMFQGMGASSLAKTLPNMAQRTLPSWLGGSSASDVQDLIDSIKTYRDGFRETIQDKYPDWKGAGAGAASEATVEGEAGPGEGDTDEPDADIEVTPEDMSKPGG